MKELSIEQKATAYDEAIERAREWSETKNGYYMPKELCEEIFPELKESEGEKIRKEITEFFKNYSENGTWKAIPDVTKWIAWLEKQGEQNPTLPKWKYKKDNTPLLRDSLILNKYGCVAKSPSGALVSDVWVIDYDELAKLPKEEFEKQCEQKHVEWSEKDASHLLRIIWFLRQNYKIKSQYKEEICSHINWLESLKDRIQPQPKVEWSEEDATMLNDCVCAIQAADEVDYSIEDKDLLINWLKSLKYRMQPQPKQEWSEEDEKKLNDVIKDLVHPWNEYIPDRIEDEIKWLKNKLKSLRPQSQWRPSEGHIFALESVIDSHPFANPRTKESLQDLVKQLKAL